MKDLVITENNSKPVEAALDAEMSNPLKHFEGELIKLRTGRAHTSLIEDIPVDCWGTIMPLKNVATLAAPDSRLLTVQPWDPSIIADIEKAILNSDVGLTPANDGAFIRLVIPEMSTTRRDELVKLLGKRLEDCKNAIRNVRKDFNNLFKDAKKDKKISEDFSNRLADILQNYTDKYTAKADQLAEKKEKEIRTV